MITCNILSKTSDLVGGNMTVKADVVNEIDENTAVVLTTMVVKIPGGKLFINSQVKGFVLARYNAIYGL